MVGRDSPGGNRVCSTILKSQKRPSWYLSESSSVQESGTQPAAKREQQRAKHRLLQVKSNAQSAHLSITLARSWLRVCLESQFRDVPLFEQPGQNFLWFSTDYKESRPLRSQLLIEVLERFQKKRSPMIWYTQRAMNIRIHVIIPACECHRSGTAGHANSNQPRRKTNM